jgi:two-component system phosphate regulon sensor histidine kinase PhoR
MVLYISLLSLAVLIVAWRRMRRLSKELVEERCEKKVILESLDEGVVTVDAAMQVRSANAAARRMLGLSKKQIQPFPSTPLFEKCCSLLKICQERRCVVTDSGLHSISSIQSPARSSDFRRFDSVYLDLIAVPGDRGAILILQDKSSHYKALEVGKDFVANASHELRTPITIIKGFAETLQDIPDMPREMLCDITEKIVRNCQRMDNLVKSLLTLADVENLLVSKFQSCDLLALAENCRRVIRAIYETAFVQIEGEQNAVCVAADPDILELALLNLLDNACKYSTPPAHIVIQIAQDKEIAKICIHDRGIGIPPGDLEHIFERFYTVDKAHSRRLGGAGLGLSLVKTIIDKHQGNISVSSALGEGTRFLIELPLSTSSS